MTESTANKTGGALADGFTLVRFIIGPIVALTIYLGWPDIGWACLASVLFALGALTDLFDDMVGGSKNAPTRIFGYFDDVADAVLVGCALIALLYVTQRAGVLAWPLLVPAAIYVGRDIIIGLVKGYEFTKKGIPSTRLGTLKTTLAMLGVSLMLGAPWLQTFIDRWVTNEGVDPMDVYGTPSRLIWQIGQGLLWLAALLAILTALRYLTRSPKPQDQA